MEKFPVLIVDDDYSKAEALILALELTFANMQLVIDHVPDAFSAYDLLAERDYGLIFLDSNLAGTNNWGRSEELREQFRGEGVLSYISENKPHLLEINPRFINKVVKPTLSEFNQIKL